MRKPIFIAITILPLIGLLVLVSSGTALAFDRGFGTMANQMLNELGNLLRHPPQALLIAAYVAGALCLTVGFRIYQFIIMLPGILVGGLLGYVFGAYGFENQIAGVLISFIGAGVGGSLVWSLHQFAIWLVGALIGGVATFAVAEFVFNTEPHGLVVVICAFLCGSLLLAMAKAFIVLKTSLIGALLIAFGARELDNIVLILGLAVIGIAVQYGVAQMLGENLPVPGFSGEKDGLLAKDVSPQVEADPPSSVAVGNEKKKAHELSGAFMPQVAEEAENISKAAEQAQTWSLSLFQNGSHVETYSLATGTYLLGRDQGVHFQLDDPAASRQHMEVEVCSRGKLLLRDLESTNGTWRQGREKIVEESPGDGDWYQVGAVQVVFATG